LTFYMPGIGGHGLFDRLKRWTVKSRVILSLQIKYSKMPYENYFQH
jgi:hypothetical protein